MIGTNNYLPNPADPRSHDLLRLVTDRKQSSLDYVRSRYKATQRWNDAFNGIYTGKIANYLNDLSLPIVFSTIMVDVAKKVNAIFGSWPVISFQGFPNGAGAIAKKNELLINLQLKEADSFRKATRFFMQADINGTAIAEVGWSTINRLRQFRTYIPGTTQMTEASSIITEFDGPNWDVVDLLDFWPEPGKCHIKDMGWYIRRYWVDFDDILEMNSADGMQSFSPEAIAELAQSTLPSPSNASDEFLTYSRYRSFSDYLGAATRTAFAMPVEIWEMRGLVPYEFAPDGVRNRVITIGNGRVILRNEPDKLLLGRHRILHYSPTPDPYHFVGIGKAQIAEPLQAAASRLANQKLDGFDLFVKPMFIAAQGSVQTQNMFTKPGKVFQVNAKGRPLNEIIQALPINMQPMAMAFQEIGFLDSYAQKGTGIDERAVMGMDTGGGDVTARQFVGQQEAAMTRLALEAMLASAELVEPMAELFRDMNKTMLPLPKQFSMIGTRAVLNEITGMPMPPEEGMITMPHELNHDWKAKAFGPGFMLTKSAQRADALQLAQVMMSNPAWLQMVNWVAMARKIFSLYDWDTDEMLVQLPQMQQFAQQAGLPPEQILAMSGQDPMSFAGGGASNQMMAPVQKGTEPTDNAPLGVGP